MALQTEMDAVMGVRALGMTCVQRGVYCSRAQRLFGDFHFKILCARLAGGLLVVGRELLFKADRLSLAVSRPALEQLTDETPPASPISAAMSMLATCRSIGREVTKVSRYARSRGDWPLSKSLRALQILGARSAKGLADWLEEGLTPEDELSTYLGLLRDCEINPDLHPAGSGRFWIGKADMSSALVRGWYLSANAHLEITSIDIVSDLIIEAASVVRSIDLVSDLAHQLLDEARHAELLATHLEGLGYSIGCVPVSLKTWALYQACGTLPERLAAQQVVQEAVGLETSALNVERMRRAGDAAAGELFLRIAADEVGHVSLGIKWLNLLAGKRAQAIVASVKEISNAIASVPDIPVIPELRIRAGFPVDWVCEEIQRRGQRSLAEIIPELGHT